MDGSTQVTVIAYAVRNPATVVGDSAYHDDPDGAKDFQRPEAYRLALIGDQLLIGK